MKYEEHRSTDTRMTEALESIARSLDALQKTWGRVPLETMTRSQIEQTNSLNEEK